MTFYVADFTALVLSNANADAVLTFSQWKAEKKFTVSRAIFFTVAEIGHK